MSAGHTSTTSTDPAAAFVALSLKRHRWDTTGFFVDWAKLSFEGFSVSDSNAFDRFRGWLSLILVVGAAIITLMRVMGKMSDKLRWPMIVVLATGVAAVLMLTIMLLGPDREGVDFGRGLGLWVSFIGSGVALAGAVMSFTAGGGDLKDLTDVNKIKDAFDGDNV